MMQHQESLISIHLCDSLVATQGCEITANCNNPGWKEMILLGGGMQTLVRLAWSPVGLADGVVVQDVDRVVQMCRGCIVDHVVFFSDETSCRAVVAMATVVFLRQPLSWWWWSRVPDPPSCCNGQTLKAERRHTVFFLCNHVDLNRFPMLWPSNIFTHRTSCTLSPHCTLYLTSYSPLKT